MIVAVPEQVMGSLSSGSDMNPLCGLKVSINMIEGVDPVTATIVDKCGGCVSLCSKSNIDGRVANLIDSKLPWILICPPVCLRLSEANRALGGTRT